MSIDKIHSQIITAIWQAVAQSGVDLSTITNPDQEKLVNQIAEKVMIAMDSLLEESTIEGNAVPAQKAEAPSGTTEEDGEEVLWEGRPFLSLVETYTLTSERLKITHGLLSRHVENYELIRIQDIDLKQGVSERILGVGDINIRGQDPSDPEIILRNVKKPGEVYELLRKAWLAARKRYGLQFREYM
jgi:hypothetical protein